MYECVNEFMRAFQTACMRAELGGDWRLRSAGFLCRPARKRVLAAHKFQNEDYGLYNDEYIRLIAHDDIGRAGVWRFVEVEGQQVLQLCEHGSKRVCCI